MITVSGLCKNFGSHAVLRDVAMTVVPGEVFAVVGHSGAGKSTLLRCLNGLEPYQAGSVKVMGREVGTLTGRDLRDARRHMGMIFQNFNLMARKNVFDNVAFPLRVWKTPTADIAPRVMELLDMVDLTGKKMARIDSLSGGQKQRVGIARALALNPEILLCDEATSALDPKTTVSILELLERINTRLGITMVVVTHQMEVVKRLCHRMLLLADGTPRALGPTEELFLSPPEELRKLIEEEYTLIPDGVNIRLKFPRHISQDSVITHMARELDVEFSIVGGKLDRYIDDVLGFLIINVPMKDFPTVRSYLEERKLFWEVLDGSGATRRKNDIAPGSANQERADTHA